MYAARKLKPQATRHGKQETEPHVRPLKYGKDKYAKVKYAQVDLA